MGSIADTVNEAITERVGLVGAHVKDFEGIGAQVEKEVLQKYFPLALLNQALEVVETSAEETVAEVANDDDSDLDPDFARMFVVGCKSGTDCLREIIAIVQAGGAIVPPKEES